MFLGSCIRYLAVVLTIVIGLPASVSAQYCGGKLEYIIRDKTGAIIDALDVRLENISASHPQIDQIGINFLFYTLVRGTGNNDVYALQQEKFRKNKHNRFELVGKGMTDMSEENKAKHKPGNVESIDQSTFAIRMGCGLPFAEMTLKYGGDVMTLRFLNVRELDGYIDSLPFQKGTFEVDIEAVYKDYPNDKSKLNTIGLRSGNSILLPYYAKSGDLIAAENWKQVN